MYRKDVIHRIRAVEADFRAADTAVRRLAGQVLDDPTILAPTGLQPADVRHCARSLEPTYLVRMFSVFEAHLRDVWTSALGRDTHPRMQDLLNGCASQMALPSDYLSNAHRVRDYRNSVVHGGPADVVPLPRAREYLCVFFGRMPHQW